MASVALVMNSDRPAAVEQAADLARWLGDEGHDVRLPGEGSPEDVAVGLDLAVSLGGDGSMLRAVHLVADEGVPVLGVNFGQLGYLTEVEPARARSAIEQVLAGDYSIEERMRLKVELTRGTGGSSEVDAALNEAVLEKIDNGRTIRLSVEIDGEFFTTYVTDGLIVSTPTGSTAYSFSARGPIVDPTHRALLLTPVAPHMLFDRSMVLVPESEVRIEVLSDRSAELAVDGREGGPLEPGDAIVCTAHDEPARLIVFGDRDFHGILKTKFGLNDR